MITFIEHLTNTLDHSQLIKLAENGADAGWPGLTSTVDCVLLYEQYEDEIWDALTMDAEDLGYDNPVEFFCTFNRIVDRMVYSHDSFKTLLVWYMAEREAQRYMDACAMDEEVA